MKPEATQCMLNTQVILFASLEKHDLITSFFCNVAGTHMSRAHTLHLPSHLLKEEFP